jgi:hypothetical protein
MKDPLSQEQGAHFRGTTCAVVDQCRRTYIGESAPVNVKYFSSFRERLGGVLFSHFACRIPPTTIAPVEECL